MPGKQISETDLSWAAGCIECDGSINITGRPPGPHEKSKMHKAVLEVSNSFLKIPEKFAELFGGEVHYRKTESGTRMGYWLAASQNAIRIIKLIRPYLVAKGRQADLAIELMSRKAVRGQNGVRLTKEEIEIRDALADECSSLNSHKPRMVQ